jgi:hypothetical protein
MMIFGFLFFLLKHNSRLDLPNRWHPQVKLMAEGLQEFNLHCTGFEPRTFFEFQGPRMGYTSEP